jgi:hypothetical protein
MNKITRRSASTVRIMAIGALVTIAGLGWDCAKAGEDATCKLVLDAMAKAVLTPNHQYMTLKIDALNGGKPTESEIIDTGKATYLKHDGKWKPGVSAQAMLDQMNENRKNAKTTCRLVREEAVDGVNARLYSVREEDADSGAVDSKVWLAMATGLPIHVSLQMEGTHSESRYVYGAVSPPPVD